MVALSQRLGPKTSAWLSLHVVSSFVDAAAVLRQLHLLCLFCKMDHQEDQHQELVGVSATYPLAQLLSFSGGLGNKGRVQGLMDIHGFLARLPEMLCYDGNMEHCPGRWLPLEVEVYSGEG